MTLGKFLALSQLQVPQIWIGIITVLISLGCREDWRKKSTSRAYHSAWHVGCSINMDSFIWQVFKGASITGQSMCLEARDTTTGYMQTWWLTLCRTSGAGLLHWGWLIIERGFPECMERRESSGSWDPFLRCLLFKERSRESSVCSEYDCPSLRGLEIESAPLSLSPSLFLNSFLVISLDKQSILPAAWPLIFFGDPPPTNSPAYPLDLVIINNSDPPIISISCTSPSDRHLDSL